MYEALIQRLREKAGAFDYDGRPDIACDYEQAADAIEELVRKEKFHAFLWNTIQPNEMEQYLTMYRAQAVPREPPKEET